MLEEHQVCNSNCKFKYAGSLYPLVLLLPAYVYCVLRKQRLINFYCCPNVYKSIVQGSRTSSSSSDTMSIGNIFEISAFGRTSSCSQLSLNACLMWPILNQS